MTTLNEIAENIAYKLGDQFNFTLRESIKDTLINYRAKFIRDDADRNFTSDVHFSQTGTIEFEVVNLLEEFNAIPTCISVICGDTYLQDKYKILRSKTEIPIAVRLKTSNKNPFSYLGRVDGSKSFTYTTLDKLKYISKLNYTQHVIYYTIINNRAYIINNLEACDINESLKICKVMLRAFFENPRDFYNTCDNNGVLIDDMPFPIGRDMLMQISNSILKGEYPLKPTDGKEVNIKAEKDE